MATLTPPVRRGKGRGNVAAEERWQGGKDLQWRRSTMGEDRWGRWRREQKRAAAREMAVGGEEGSSWEGPEMEVVEGADERRWWQEQRRGATWEVALGA